MIIAPDTRSIGGSPQESVQLLATVAPQHGSGPAAILITEGYRGMMISHQDEALARSHQPAPRGKVVSRTTGMWPRRTRQTARAPALRMRRVFLWPDLPMTMWATATFTNIHRWTAMDRGGHFAAMERPEELAAEIREFFRPLRANNYDGSQ